MKEGRDPGGFGDHLKGVLQNDCNSNSFLGPGPLLDMWIVNGMFRTSNPTNFGRVWIRIGYVDLATGLLPGSHVSIPGFLVKHPNSCYTRTLHVP